MWNTARSAQPTGKLPVTFLSKAMAVSESRTPRAIGIRILRNGAASLVPTQGTEGLVWDSLNEPKALSGPIHTTPALQSAIRDAAA